MWVSVWWLGSETLGVRAVVCWQQTSWMFESAVGAVTVLAFVGRRGVRSN